MRVSYIFVCLLFLFSPVRVMGQNSFGDALRRQEERVKPLLNPFEDNRAPVFHSPTTNHVFTKESDTATEEDKEKPMEDIELQQEPDQEASQETQIESVNNFADAEPVQAETFVVERVEFTGEVDFWNSLKSTSDEYEFLADKFRAELIGKKCTWASLSNICRGVDENGNKKEDSIIEELKKQGYLLVRLNPEPPKKVDSRVTVEINVAFGAFGNVVLRNKGEDRDSEENNSFSGLFFSEEQVAEALDFETGAPFNYNTFYSKIFAFNSNPDLTADGVLTIRETDEGQQYVDMAFDVEEDFPFHTTLTIDNTNIESSENSGEWRSSLTLQYLNLTKNWDVLSFDFGYALDGSLQSGAGSYYFPFTFFTKDMAVTLFGGYSTQELENITTGIDTESEGHFIGLQLQSELANFGRRSLSATFELTNRYTENQILALNQAFPTELTIAPVSVGLNYSETESDAIGGRNFAAYTFSMNSSGWLGSDGDEAFAQARVGASSDYMIHRFQIARIQRLLGKNGKWLLYLKGSTQYADGPLPPSEQLSLGGMTTVRGYKERQVLGDNGYLATVEIRTPLLDRRLLGFNSSEKPFETLQFLVFGDYGYTERLEPQPGEYEDVDMIGVGAGMRVGLAGYSQIRVDYGIALSDLEEELGEETDAGRLHISVQGQF